MRDSIRIGTRGSQLALYQAELVKTLLNNELPLLKVEILKIKTSGDMIRHSNAQPFDTNSSLGGNQDDAVATGSLTNCFANGTGSNDAFDMSGNIREWTQPRSPGANPMRGGAANATVNGTTCALDFTLADDTFFFPNVGFRCCR